MRSPRRFWRRATALLVPGPKRPSTATGIPRERSSRCRARTAGPRDPITSTPDSAKGGGRWAAPPDGAATAATKAIATMAVTRRGDMR